MAEFGRAIDTDSGAFMLNAGDIARGADHLVGRERQCMESYLAASSDDRDRARIIVRASLLRLFDNLDNWMPGGVLIEGDRIDIHLSIEFDGTIDEMVAESRAQLAQRAIETRRQLIHLARQLEAE